MSLPRIRLISRDNVVGLSRDLDLMASVLAGEAQIERIGFGGRTRTRFQEAGLWASRLLDGRVAVQIFAERVHARCLPLAERNLLLPNPEWFLPRWHHLLPRFDAVLCKTRHAERIFRGLGCNTRHVGFTSEDRMLPGVPRKRAFFHLAGRSSAKGTQVLLDTWKRHPEWPLLTVVQHPKTCVERVLAANIDHRLAYMDDRELRLLQNAHLFHLCPSETEGYGHYIVEALSVGAIVLATAGEPMSELVTAQRGIPIVPADVRRHDLVRRYYVDQAGIEHAIGQALGLSASARAEFSRRARRHFIDNDRIFRQRFTRAVLGYTVCLPSMPLVRADG